MCQNFSHISNSTLEAIPQVAEKIELWGEENNLPSTIIFQVNLILEELMTNIISYGHHTHPEKKILLTLCLESNTHLIITLLDEAPPFNPLLQESISIEKALDDRPIGGLGIHFVKTLTDRIEYRYTDQGNQLTLYKTI